LRKRDKATMAKWIRCFVAAKIMYVGTICVRLADAGLRIYIAMHVDRTLGCGGSCSSTVEVDPGNGPATRHLPFVLHHVSRRNHHIHQNIRIDGVGARA
jgi:hypothetical protein